MRINLFGTIVENEDKWIYDWFGMEAVCPKNIIDAIAKADDKEPIDVYINSPGGSVFAGSSIYSALRELKDRVKIHVVGIAASAASVVACAGQSDISPTAMLMIHNSSSACRGDYHAMDKESEVLQQVNKAIASAYVAKTGMSEQEALELMDRESWITAPQAVEYGLIDAIAGQELNKPANSSQMQIVASLGNIIPKENISKLSALIKETDYLNAQIEFLKLKGNAK